MTPPAGAAEDRTVIPFRRVERRDGSADDAGTLLQGQTEVLELIAATAPLTTILDRILTSLEALLVTARCSVLLLDRDGRSLRHGAAPSLPTSYVEAIDGLTIGPSSGACGTAAFHNEQVVCADITRDWRWRDFRSLASSSGLGACWSTPITGRTGMPVGTFAVYHRRPHRPTPRERQLVARFTHLAAVAIEHARLVDDLVDSEERFRRAFHDNAAAMALLYLDLRVDRTNAVMRRLTALPAVDPASRPFTSLFTAADRPDLQRQLADLAAGRIGEVRLEAAVRRSSGAATSVELTASPVLDAAGVPRRLCITMLDMTAREEAESADRARREAEIARRVAEEHSRHKSELLRTVSHEVRTPLQAITGFAEQLTTLGLDEARRRQALDSISTAAGHVGALLTDVLELSRIESRALSIVPEVVAVSALLQEVCEVLGARIRERGMTMRVDGGGVRLHADPLRVRQVLLNLVGNAIRHGRDGGRIDVAAGRLGSRVAIEVRDDGPGIPRAFLPSLFVPFTRAGSPEGGDGYGLGLSLAHGLVTAMDGTLEVGSTGPAGTTMRVELPGVDR